MGRGTFSRTAFHESVSRADVGTGPVTARAERQARETGTLHPLVDPAGYDVIRRSLLRFEQQPNGLWLVTIGTPVPVETRLDTTGSMGGNVDVAFRVLPNAYELISQMLPGCDLQIATGIFGDVGDRFVLCRPQFEAVAEKIVPQLTYMVPERAGGDIPEDPHYGLFGAAYLTASYLVRIGLKSYDFTVTDAPARPRLDASTLVRVFGSDVFKKTAENGHQIDPHRLPTTKEVVRSLLTRAHAFLLLVGDNEEAKYFWKDVYGPERVVVLPSTEMLPQVQACIVGLTEGTLGLRDVNPFLVRNGVSRMYADAIARSVTNIPIGAQAALPNFGRRPRAGDLFRSKTDLWPMTPEELDVFAAEADSGAKDTNSGTSPGVNWL